MVTKCHEKVANARADFQHKRSRMLIDENQAVIVETLKSANIMKNRKLAKHQAKEQGKHLVKLDPWYASSKTCHGCAHKLEAMPLSVRKWDCPACGVTDIDRDLNAALNICDKGILELKAPGHSFLLMEAA
jgi:putative transposase